eukprot:CAMPEP_0115189032 /NCGR_PEP_ID=MMETSP0270-20121206/11312_1 /TAXON_ID=71861 /ORGANISM="Scrippsiella trochoidea, Strain CCMP3099" /LENGTH=595 /DNA_ID=CAMNT_0002602223 /DNA_START=99 /DNA_END=1887 /DNA_ORIENTATION=-
MKSDAQCLPVPRSCSRTLRSLGRKFSRKSSRSVQGAGSACPEGAGMLGGFVVQTEAPAIEVRPDCVAPFSFPEELLTYEPCPEAVRATFKNGDTERTVHCHVEFTAEERQKLEVMRAGAKEDSKEFLPSVATAASRFLARARGDPKRALREMCATQEWRLNYFRDGPLRDATLEEDLSLGIVYFTGRDRWMRPALVVRPARIPAMWQKDKRMATDKLVRLLVFCMEYMMTYMLLPGRVEGGVVLVDMSGLTSTQVPFGPLKSIITVMANHYVNRIFRFYMFNLPTALSMTAQMGMRFLTDRQRQKVHIVKDFREMQQEFALHQLEEDFGGSRPNAEQFFPFPLPAGPFTAGASEGARADAIPAVYLALTATCLQGRPWDPALSREENRRLQYTSIAADMLAGRLAGIGLSAPLAAATSTSEVEELQEGDPTSTAAATITAAAREWPRPAAASPCSHHSSEDREASRGDSGEAALPTESPALGGKGEDIASMVTNDDGSSSPSTTFQEWSISDPHPVILEDGEVRLGTSWFCKPFQCSEGSATLREVRASSIWERLGDAAQEFAQQPTASLATHQVERHGGVATKFLGSWATLQRE